MFEAMAGNFVHPEDIQLFLNVITGNKYKIMHNELLRSETYVLLHLQQYEE